MKNIQERKLFCILNWYQGYFADDNFGMCIFGRWQIWQVRIDKRHIWQVKTWQLEDLAGNIFGKFRPVRLEIGLGLWLGVRILELGLGRVRVNF